MKGTSTRSSDIYCYRFDKKGLMAAADVSGTVLSTDSEADATFYGKPEISPKQIFEGMDLQVPSVAEKLTTATSKYVSMANASGSAPGTMGVSTSAEPATM